MPTSASRSVSARCSRWHISVPLRRAAGGSTRSPGSRSRRRRPRRAPAARPAWRRRPRAWAWISVVVPARKRRRVRRPQRGRPVARRRSARSPSPRATPRSNQAAPSKCSRSTGIASSTSLPTTTPFIRSGSASSQRTTPANARGRCALALAQRRRQLDDRVAADRARRARRAARPRARRSRRRTPRPRRCREASSASSTWRASARPNSGDSSGAVTKSLPTSGMRPTTIRPLA